MAAIFKTLNITKPTDYTISSWLLLGACIQCILVATLPRNLSLLPPIIVLGYRILRSYLVATGHLPDGLLSEAYHGRQTWQIPTSRDGSTTKSSSESIVVLVLAATWNHPNGRFSPGSSDLGGYFTKMWDDAEAIREKYGFLGNTPSLVVEASGDRPDGQGYTVVYLSYWKSLEGLGVFAHAKPHMKGQLWWEKGAGNEFPHIGIMHETYEVPAGSWENVFHNFRPFGISNAKYPVSGKATGGEDSIERAQVEWVSGLQSADKKDWKTMLRRMGRHI
ncbi:hypothetical protein ACN47E_007235 [Coniothyrium glycines]